MNAAANQIMHRVRMFRPRRTVHLGRLLTVLP